MTTDDALFFIDANKYLDLYRTMTGRHSLAGIGQQADHIFVTQKVVDEVKRNTIKETANFLTNHFNELPLVNTNVPDQLFGATEDQSKSIKRQVDDIRRTIKQVNTDLRTLKMDIMKKVGQSTDEVSTVLAPIFAKAVPHSDKQLQQAKARKERGDPPGKKTDPIGDELTWEQILCQFVGKTKLWIVTRDSDYGSMYGEKQAEKGFLNRLLYDELQQVSPGAEAFLFANVPDAIQHFADVTGVKADELPTPEQREEMKKEEEEIKEKEESLSPSQALDWMFTGTDPAFYDAHRRYQQRRRRAFFDTQGRLQPLTLSLPPEPDT
jgi:hypothetical protein